MTNKAATIIKNKLQAMQCRVKSLCLGAAVASAMVLPTTALGWDYANVPLFWDAGINPNVAFMIDDSGSMQALVTNEAYRKALDTSSLPTQNWYWCNGTYTAGTKKCNTKNSTVISNSGFRVRAWTPPTMALSAFTINRTWYEDNDGVQDCSSTSNGFMMNSISGTPGNTSSYTATGICKANHGFKDGDTIKYISKPATGATNLVTTTTYYVVNASDHGFQLTTTLVGGAANTFTVTLGTSGTFSFTRADTALPQYIGGVNTALCNVSLAPGAANFYVGVTNTATVLTAASLPTADNVGVLVSNNTTANGGTRDSCVRWKLASTARTTDMAQAAGRDYNHYAEGTLYYTPGHSGTNEYGRFLLNTLLPATGFNSLNMDDSSQYPDTDADTSNFVAAIDNKIIPNVTRIQAAREVGQRVVLDFYDVMNIGVFSFNSQMNLAIADGSDPDAAKTDLIGSTEGMTPADLPGSVLDGAIGGLNAEESTPLAKTQDAINKYYKGTLRVDSDGFSVSSGGTVKSSPIKYRCQKNYSIVMTDGDPTSDSDTLDNRAQQAYDMDAKTTGTDADGVSWGTVNGDGTYDKWAQQNVVTYTVGFGLENDLLKRTPLVNKITVPQSDVSSTVITLEKHGLETGNYMQVVSGESGTGLTDGSYYYVAEGSDADHFKLATTKARAITCADSGTNCITGMGAITTGLVISTGPGKSFFSYTPEQLAQNVGDVFDTINTITSSSAAVSTNAKQFGAGGLIFQARFKTEDWSGEVLAYEVVVDEDTGKATVDTSDTATPFWTTRTALADAGDRTTNIFTWNTTSGLPVAFDWANVSVAQQNALGGATEGPKTVNWMKGQDVAGLRDHSTNGLLGDVLNSDPLFLSGLNFGYNMLPASNMAACTIAGDGSSATGSGCTGAEIYTTYYNKTSVTPATKRDARLFVGANDGMLHVLDANNGQEKMAYVPAAVYQDWTDANNDGINNDALKENRLYDLARPSYDHRFSVDGSLTAADVFLGGVWKTYVVGALGAGGRSIFALDATDTLYSSSDVKWEFTNPNMGYTYGKPIVARLADNNWYAIMPNGLDSAGDNASVFLIRLDNPAIYKELKVNDGSLDPNGMTSIQVRLNGQRTVTDIYAGDIRGNIWKFDLYNEGSNSVSWTEPGAPLFTARDSGGDVQSITGGIRIGRHPGGLGSLVYFGTGKYFEKSDNLYVGTTVPQVDSFYAVLDNGTTTGLTRAQLQMQEFTMFTKNGDDFRTASQNAVSYTGSEMGWYIDLLNGTTKLGERVVSNPVLYGGRIIFVSIIPLSGGTCGGEGYSWLNELDALSGGRLEEQALDLNGDGKIDAADGNTVAASAQIDGLGSDPSVSPGGDNDYKVVGSTSSTQSIQIVSETKPPESGLPGGKGRMSWKQLQ